jgi:hypothetical protein
VYTCPHTGVEDCNFERLDKVGYSQHQGGCDTVSDRGMYALSNAIIGGIARSLLQKLQLPKVVVVVFSDI